jgi:phosphoserine phosphatase
VLKLRALVSATARFGKVARLEQLTEEFDVPLDRVVYVGDRRSDIHVMSHLSRQDGFAVAVSEPKQCPDV